jgi:hypothetical protein
MGAGASYGREQTGGSAVARQLARKSVRKQQKSLLTASETSLSETIRPRRILPTTQGLLVGILVIDHD